MDQIYVKPLKGLSIRMPKTKAILPEMGGWVPADNYWLRRMNEGSVVEVNMNKKVVEEKTEEIKNNKEVKKNGYSV